MQSLLQVIIAFADRTLLGSAMLITHDMETRMELSPWLASVYVAPDRRGRGMGTELVRRFIDDARALNVPRLYLYTPGTEQFYSRLGWSPIAHTSYRGTNVAVMSYECRSCGE